MSEASQQAVKRPAAAGTTVCPVCSREVRPRTLYGGKVLACPTCSLGWTEPPPPIALDDYVEDRVNDSTNYLENGELHRSFPKRLARFVRRAAKGKCSGRALDIGCNVGYLIEELNALGYAAEGVEPNTTAARVAQEHGLRVRVGVLDEHESSGAYALVTMSHVLEHVTPPQDLLREVHRVLQPGGLLVVSQPNYQGLVARTLSKQWYGWQTTMHYWHFTGQSLRTLFAACDFDVVALERNSMHHPFPHRGEGNLRYALRQSALAVGARVGDRVRMGDQLYVAARAR